MSSASPVAAIPCFLNSAEAASTILLRVFAVSCLDILITQLFLKTLGPTSSQRFDHCCDEPQGHCPSISCPVAGKTTAPKLEDTLSNHRPQFVCFPFDDSNMAWHSLDVN